MSSHSPKEIYTIGHSTRSMEDFIELLQASSIELLADVRSVPKSRFNPQFNRDTLPVSLAGAGIEYAHFRELGGWKRSTLEHSPNEGWRSPGFRNFADYMLTEKFREGLENLISKALEHRTAIMCAEALPWRCHRNLISDALTIHGFHVMHIMGKAGIHKHTLTPWAHVSGTSITYPPLPEQS